MSGDMRKSNSVPPLTFLGKPRLKRVMNRRAANRVPRWSRIKASIRFGKMTVYFPVLIHGVANWRFQGSRVLKGRRLKKHCGLVNLLCNSVNGGPIVNFELAAEGVGQNLLDDVADDVLAFEMSFSSKNWRKILPLASFGGVVRFVVVAGFSGSCSWRPICRPRRRRILGERIPTDRCGRGNGARVESARC